MYPDLADEWFSDEDILNGCLEDMMMLENDDDDNNLVCVEYELVQEHPPIRSSSFWENVWESFYDPASEAEEKKARQILLLSASFAVPMIVIFFTSTSFGSDVSTVAKIWLIITGICGMINFMYSFFITPYCQQSSVTFPAMFSSGIYMICVLILLIGLLMKWNQWTRIWEGLVGFILGFVIVALLSAIANFYAYNQLRIIHTRKESNINNITVTTSTSTSTELSPIYSDNPTEIV